MVANIKSLNKFIVNKDNLFFLVYLFLFLSQMISEYSNLSDLLGRYTRYISVLLYCGFLVSGSVILFYYQKYQVKELIVYMVLLVVSVLIYYKSGGRDFLDCMLIICISKDINFKEFARKALKLWIAFMLFVVFFSCIGVIDSMILIRIETGRLRNSLGFSHPNSLGIYVFQIIAGYMYIYCNEKFKISSYFIMLVITSVIYYITDSQTSFVLSCMLILFVAVYCSISRGILSLKQINRILRVGILMACVIVYYMIRYYWIHTDELSLETLVSRINLAQKYLNAYGVNLFGNNILMGNNVALPGYVSGYSYLDNSQVWYLVKYGVVGFVIFFANYAILIVKTIKQRETILCVIGFIYLIYSVFEVLPCKICFNFMLIYMGIVLHKSNKHSGLNDKNKFLQ